MKRHSAVILAVGSELTIGQITNRNASLISQRLEDFGLTSVAHLTVPDDRKQILYALRESFKLADYVFVTGGLGPTSDDFTRNVVADFLKAPLAYNETEWQAIVAMLAKRGVEAREIQRQQSFFPKRAQILSNPVGTASGFYSRRAKQHLWVLPGPPRELLAIWENHIEAQLAVLRKNSRPIRQWIWQCLGQPESVVAELTEKTIKGEKLQVGYRVHLPYIEVKLWDDGRARSEKIATRLDEALAPWVVAREDQDLAEIFCEKLVASEASFVLVDEVSRGYLHERVTAAAQALKCELRGEIHTVWRAPAGLSAQAESQNEKTRKSIKSVFILSEISSTEFKVEHRSPGSSSPVIEKLAWTGGPRLAEYLRKWAVEKALYNWIR